ncbi:hypothetical protein QWY85_15775 [Neolewinella lacunae]|uniref:Uncharacterized protein n=1 Tax=Neolewinella lacunae TaxID=1517758 RepID=A0A923PGL6_9BACT|nr:hypothetical protein [Neolewinella lacunae]MBC6993707.1 hypothetical protein [Neolewinella lacunae]MDN3636127.1 hypothetical protein [Neolewinella lacunae]
MDLTTALFLFLTTLIGIVGIFAWIVNGSLSRLNATLVALDQRSTAPVAPADRENSTNLRLQACERLTLMLERINVPNLLLRLPAPAPATTAKEYTAGLLLSIQQEFEYNVTQQVYVSDALWSVLLQARDNVSQLIVRAAEGADSGEQVLARLRLMSTRQPEDAIALAQSAVRKEAAMVLG